MKPTAPDADFLRLAQVAALLNVSESEVRRARDRGELACCWRGSLCLIPRQSYEALRDRLLREAGVLAVPVRAVRGAR